MNPVSVSQSDLDPDFIQIYQELNSYGPPSILQIHTSQTAALVDALIQQFNKQRFTLKRKPDLH